MTGRQRIPAVWLALMGLAVIAAQAAAAAAPAARAWPKSSRIVPFEYRRGQLMFQATLHSPSGRAASGPMMLDTGAPGVALTRRVFESLEVDEMQGKGGTFTHNVRRPLDLVEMGELQLPGLPVPYAFENDRVDPDVIGIFGPVVLGDRPFSIDYRKREWVVHDPGVVMIRADTTRPRAGISPALRARLHRSRSSLGGLLAASAHAVPIRLYPGGRIMVDVRIEDPAHAWRSHPIHLLLDTGATSCALFSDAIQDRLGGAPRWPRRDVPVRTMLGGSVSEGVVLPRLVLSGAMPPLSATRVEAGDVVRGTLPDIQGAIPETFDGLLGNTFLERFRVTLDPRNELVWLEPIDRPGQLGDTGGLLGMSLEARWGAIRVTEVTPASPAARAGVAAEDVIVSIAGTPVGEANAADVRRLLGAGPGDSVTLTVRRANIQRIVTLVRGAR